MARVQTQPSRHVRIHCHTGFNPRRRPWSKRPQFTLLCKQGLVGHPIRGLTPLMRLRSFRLNPAQRGEKRPQSPCCRLGRADRIWRWRRARRRCPVSPRLGARGFVGFRVHGDRRNLVEAAERGHPARSGHETCLAFGSAGSSTSAPFRRLQTEVSLALRAHLVGGFDDQPQFMGTHRSPSDLQPGPDRRTVTSADGGGRSSSLCSILQPMARARGGGPHIATGSRPKSAISPTRGQHAGEDRIRTCARRKAAGPPRRDIALVDWALSEWPARFGPAPEPAASAGMHRADGRLS